VTEWGGCNKGHALISAAAPARIDVYYRILPQTRVQQLTAGSLEAVSEECCLGEECSHVVGVEVVCTTGTPHTRATVARGEAMAESRIAPHAPSHNRTLPGPVGAHC